VRERKYCKQNGNQPVRTLSLWERVGVREVNACHALITTVEGWTEEKVTAHIPTGKTDFA
jgi:hypothetical protein